MTSIYVISPPLDLAMITHNVLEDERPVFDRMLTEMLRDAAKQGRTTLHVDFYRLNMGRLSNEQVRTLLCEYVTAFNRVPGYVASVNLQDVEFSWERGFSELMR